MKIHAMLWICPECRKTVTFTPHPDGTFYTSGVICAEDGYSMFPIRVDTLMIDNLLKHRNPNAPGEATGTQVT